METRNPDIKAQIARIYADRFRSTYNLRSISLAEISVINQILPNRSLDDLEYQMYVLMNSIAFSDMRYSGYDDNDNDSHDAAHYLSGNPPTWEGEERVYLWQYRNKLKNRITSIIEMIHA